MRQRTALNTAYQMEQYFEPKSFARDTSGSIQHYKNKWIRYEQGRHLPQAELLRSVEEKVPGSTRELRHPLWSVLDLGNSQVMRGDAFLRQLTPAVQDVLFQPAQSGVLRYETRCPVTPLLLEKLERRASLDVLACLVWLRRDAAERQSEAAVRIGHTLHNVVTMMGIELHALKVALPLLRQLIDHVLPLGVPPHHRMWMIPSDYIHASSYLNRIAYQIPKGRQQELAWGTRVKIMQQLLQGKFGFDVRYAMSPQFKLDGSTGEVSAEIIETHARAGRQREWGWECIRTGKRGWLPPDDLL
ncbi:MULTISPECIES: hypothetical protein [unclassified Pseudomonas]|uniref:hypothetical protein n=1 Tax=unclassified Pseudomonas TaxID=196821 RepID=UPI00244A7174|nr:MULTISPECIES: hypothetical protein [unclassified Pseudomonas]MDG9924476.1 hypothetical protein [Pseudomonas sp. GD04045]MDH0035184.1 hypothetical protein [Pseudomonas sp. GD04019]